MPWTVYIIRSKLSERYYKGCCEDFEKRLAEHNAGKTRSTKAYRPWIKTYLETFESKTDALKREKHFKTRSGFRWLKEHNISPEGWQSPVATSARRAKWSLAPKGRRELRLTRYTGFSSAKN